MPGRHSHVKFCACCSVCVNSSPRKSMATDVETGPAVGATVSSDDMEIIAAKLLQGGKPFNPIDGLDEKQLKALNELRQIMQPFIEGDPKWKAFCDDMCLCRYLRYGGQEGHGIL